VSDDMRLDTFTTLAEGLDDPEGVAWGPDGRVYGGGEALAFPNGCCVSAGGRNDARRLPSPASTLAPSPGIPLCYPTP
jgi:hypothetical protein